MQFNFFEMCKCIIALDNFVNESDSTYTIEQSCENLRNELNKFSPDFVCREVIFTPNTDKPFFGIFIRPLWVSPADFCRKILAGYGTTFGVEYGGCIRDYERFKPNKYCIELDGKLFRDFNLTPVEICSIIVKEIIAMNSAEPIDKLRSIIDTYISLTNSQICIESVTKSVSIFEMVCSITLHNITSIFTKNDSDDLVITAEHPLAEYEDLTVPYRTAIDKIRLKSKADIADTRAMMINWYFSHYKQIEMSRDFQYTIKNCIEIEPSKLIRFMLILSLRSIENMTKGDEMYYHSQLLTESSKKKGLIYQMKRNGLRSIEEDLFEYNMRLRNVETQDEAILLMRQINSRMSILEEYLETEELDEKERKRWEDCYKKYLDIREALSKKTVYNKKMYGLFVDYNALQNMSQSGNLMNTYY